MRPHVDVQVALGGSARDGVPKAEQIEAWVAAVLDATDDARRLNALLTIRIVGRDEITALNADYRQKHGVTNVLSFPFDMPPGIDDAELAATLGDLVVCAPVVRDEACEQGKAVAAHWAHMVVHGTLHLLGYDHIVDSEARQMEALEVSILAGFGIENPYADE